MIRVCLDIFVWPVWLSLLAPRIQLVLVFLSRYFAILAMGKTLQQVNETEPRLVKMMVKDGVPWTQIQRITGRSSDTINTSVKSKAVSEGSGAAIQFSAKDLDKVLKVTESMVKRADAQSEPAKGQKHTIKTIDRSSTTRRPLIDRSSTASKNCIDRISGSKNLRLGHYLPFNIQDMRSMQFLLVVDERSMSGRRAVDERSMVFTLYLSIL